MQTSRELYILFRSGIFLGCSLIWWRLYVQLENICSYNYTRFWGFGACQLDGKHARAFKGFDIQWYRQALDIECPIWIKKVNYILVLIFSFTTFFLGHWLSKIYCEKDSVMGSSPFLSEGTRLSGWGVNDDMFFGVE